MYYKLLTVLTLLVLIAGCGKKELSKEAILLQTKSADEVAYSYEQIVAMSDAELTEKMKEVSTKLHAKRNALPPSVAGASVGGGSSDAPPTDASTEAPAVDDSVTVESLALPLEVMKQEQANRK